MDVFKYSYKDTLKENPSLSVYNTGCQKCPPGYGWGPAMRDHYLIHYIASGCGTYRANDRIYALEAGDLFVVYPNQLVYYEADKAHPWEYYWVGFHGTEARRLMDLTPFTPQSPCLHQPADNQIRSLLYQIYTAGGHTPSAEAEMTGGLYLLLGYFIRQCEKNGCLPPQSHAYLMQAVRYIEHNYSNPTPISVEDIAAYAGVSRSQLYRAFIRYYQLSPMAFLTQYRINAACCLLRRHNITIAEAACSVGFSDPLYFSRVFKKAKGVSPTVYRRHDS